MLKDAGGTTDNALARALAVEDQRVEERGLDTPSRPRRSRREGRRRAAIARARHARYEERLAAYQAVDFDDLIGLPLALLREHDEVRAKLARRGCATCWSTNTRTPTRAVRAAEAARPAQRGRFTAVGDDDQAIYGWRGATLDNLKRLPADFPT